MSLYKDYVKERRAPNGGVIEDDNGFVTYYLFPEHKECYIDDIYVVPSKRKDGIAKLYQEKVTAIVKPLGFDKLTGTVDITAVGSELSTILLIKDGFKFSNLKDNLIYFIKEI